MLFNSWVFVGLVIATAIVYYLPFLKRRQLYVLLIASFLFYAYDNLSLLLLLIASGMVNAMASYGAMYDRRSRLFATSGVVVNLCLLALFKYGGLLSATFLDMSSGVGKVLCTLPLPLGISFYTFSGISLVVDAYRGKFDAASQSIRPSFWAHSKKTLLYICFFPKLLAGPIAKSKEFFSDIADKQFRDICWPFVFKSLVVGYFLKMVVADNLKDFTFWMAYPYFELRGTGSLLLMVFGYSFQMFADFAGYSLIAIGIAAIFGYRLPTNFHFPYIASSFREFWKRWHITLSQFLMEYLYISLGGNRKGKARTYVNLLLTMMLGGLWHGAAWSYLVWGTYHGLCLVVERAICGRRENCIALGRWRSVSHWVSIAFVFVLVSFGWLLFMLPNFSEAALYMQCIFTNYGSVIFIDPKLLPIIIYATPVVVYHLLYYYRNRVWVQKYVLRFNYIFYGIMLFLILTNSGSANSFVYFQF
ncbi:MAG: MBOAT family protein [Bacteroidaceae bacterium]|nr:MBOAT family protein [Bacteroidaceae bacterium]